MALSFIKTSPNCPQFTSLRLCKQGGSPVWTAAKAIIFRSHPFAPYLGFFNPKRGCFFKIRSEDNDYIDYERMGRNMEISGDAFTIETAHDQVHVFWGH